MALVGFRPKVMGDWARAVGVRPSQFARVLLGYYDPALFHVLLKDGKE
jgi:hypothetical protein